MKLIIIPALFVSLFAFHPAYAVGAYDLQCMLDNGEQMTLSHVSNTVYISLKILAVTPKRAALLLNWIFLPAKRNRLWRLIRKQEPLFSHYVEKMKISKARLQSITQNMMVQVMLITLS